MAYIFTQTGAEIQEILNKAAAQTELVSLTWAELKALRDAGQLVPGVQYRITDFVTSTNATATAVRSAGHAFDIIVTADNAATLNENARACLHDGDNYFAGANLAGWRLKYCLDNLPGKYGWLVGTDTPPSVTIESGEIPEVSGTYTYNRQITEEEILNILGADEGPWFEWQNGTEIIIAINSATPDFAQIQTGDQKVVYTDTYFDERSYSVSGDDISALTYTAAVINAKGTVYWMQDEWGNEAPWDFKNVQIYRRVFYTSIDYSNVWCHTFNLVGSYAEILGDLSLYGKWNEYHVAGGGSGGSGGSGGGGDYYPIGCADNKIEGNFSYYSIGPQVVPFFGVYVRTDSMADAANWKDTGGFMYGNKVQLLHDVYGYTQFYGECKNNIVLRPGVTAVDCAFCVFLTAQDMSSEITTEGSTGKVFGQLGVWQ